MFKLAFPNVRSIVDTSGRWRGYFARLCAATLVAAALGCGGGPDDLPPEPRGANSAPEDDLPEAHAAWWSGTKRSVPDEFSSPDGDGGTVTSDSSDAGDPADEGSAGAYQSCEGNQRACTALGPNLFCASYTYEPANSFCAPICQNDEACPALPGFEAACNFFWCALLCDQGTCPTGMVCQPGMQFIDTQGVDRGLRDVCVIAP